MKMPLRTGLCVCLSTLVPLIAASSLAAQDTAAVQVDQTPAAAGKNSVETSGEGTAAERTEGYDPLAVPKDEVETIEPTVQDDRRSRAIPLLVYLSKATEPAPVIIHSHGLGGTKNTSPFLGKHWAARGYVAVFVQHPGSDDSVWKDIPKLQRFRAMRQAASGENLTLRTGDVVAVLDQLEKWNVEPTHALNGRLDLKHVGMSGHSFGAVTTQQVSGQSSFRTQRFTDRRITAAIPMSPSFPRVGGDRAFNKVSIPWLCMTGTQDVSKIGGADVESRMAVYPALPNGDKYELVLFEAEHSVFTEQALPGDRAKRNPNHHEAIKAISTAFWDAHLREDDAAKTWLTTDAVRSVLETQDRWQTK